MLAKKKILAPSLLGLAFGTMSFCAQAAGVALASASIGNFSYQLIDLNLTDGIAPSLTFTSFSSTSSSSSMSRGSDGGTHTLSGLGSTRFQGVNGAASTTVTQSGITSSASPTVPQNDYNGFSSKADYVQRFTLSADTLVIFSSTANFSTIHIPGSHSLIAGAGLRGQVLNGVQPGQPANTSRFADSFTLYDSTDGSEVHNLVLRGSLQSFGYTTFGEVSMEAHWLADLYITPIGQVPEPQTYAMLFAGLGLVAGALRRKRLGAR